MRNDPRFELGCKAFDDGDYFEAHETWEEIWMEATGPLHAYLQGLIQVAVALHHASRGNFRGTRKLFASALDYLERGAGAAETVDLTLLKEKVLDFELALQKRDSGEQVDLPFFDLPRRL